MGLKPFRNIPQDLVEWTRWCNEQDIPASSTSSTSTDTALEIEDFAGNYVIQSADAGKIKRSTGGSATNVTLNPGTLSQGEQVTILQYGAGTVTIVAGSGETIRTPSTLVSGGQYETIRITALTSAEAVIDGRMAP